uniref:TPX2_importin domain-containing protein n=1 Tax=Macrostomum lignano TaxID=282301 RepID=A0A1I8F567_9PLAT
TRVPFITTVWSIGGDRQDLQQKHPIASAETAAFPKLKRKNPLLHATFTHKARFGLRTPLKATGLQKKLRVQAERQGEAETGATAASAATEAAAAATGRWFPARMGPKSRQPPARPCLKSCPGR